MWYNDFIINIPKLDQIASKIQKHICSLLRAPSRTFVCWLGLFKMRLRHIQSSWFNVYLRYRIKDSKSQPFWLYIACMQKKIGPMCVQFVYGANRSPNAKNYYIKNAPFVIRFDAFDLDESTIERKRKKKVKRNQNREDSNSSSTSNNINTWDADWKKIPLARIGMCACFNGIGFFSFLI